MASLSAAANVKNPLRGAVEILPDQLYYCALKTPPSSNKLLLRNKHNKKVPVICFSIDATLVYWNFFLDFGPLNLGQLYRFTTQLNDTLKRSQNTTVTSSGERPCVLFYSSTNPAKRANAIYLICAWQVLELRRTPEQAFYGFSYHLHGTKGSTSTGNIPTLASRCSLPPPSPLTKVGQDTISPLPPWHDASPVVCAYRLNLMHCLQGLKKAKEFGFFDFTRFNVEEYEHFEQVENGDLNWIIDGKIMAFAGPSFTKNISREGYCTLAPSDYLPYFKKKRVGLVVRLNKRNYDENDFIKNGIKHLEQVYLDGSCPPMNILQRVLQEFESVPSNQAFAVHCKAGLGRTGTCIGAYIMKHYRMTAPEVISWMRICRPGMVIGPQQQFLQDIQPVMWQEGEMMKIGQRVPITPAAMKTLSRSISQDQTSPDAIDGRPGQADGLLSRRKPVPVTPDTTVGASNRSSPGFFKSNS